MLQQNRNAADKEPDYFFRTASLYLLKSQGRAGNNLSKALSLDQELLQKYANTDFAFLAQTEVDQLGVSGFAKCASETSLPASSSQTFTLYPNHQNPFDPETTIKHTLPKPTRVKLVIYDMLGREVKTLGNELQQQGVKSVVWDGKNNHGQPLPNGLYLCRIVAEGFTQSSKSILLK